MKGTINIDLKEEKRSRVLKTILTLILMAAFGAGGFLTGRKTISPITVDKPIYIPGDTIKIEVPVPTPVYVTRPADTADIIAKCVRDGIYAELFPEKVRDSLIYVPTAEDTLEIVRDWATERYYEKKIFDVDTLGTATVRAKTQYNRITEMSAEVIPVVKTVTQVMPQKKYEPFVGLGATTYPSVMVQAGSFIDGKWGGALVFQKDVKDKGKSFGVAVVRKF